MFRSVVAMASAVVVGLALVPGAAAAETAGAETEAERAPSASPARTLVKQVATNWRHAAGHPAAGVAHTVTGASVTIDVYGSSLFVKATARLGTPADSATEPGLAVQFGHRNSAGTCVGSASAIEWSDTSAATRNHRVTGHTPDDWGAAPSTPWECVMVLRAKVHGSVEAGFHDVYVGTLVNTYQAPRLKVGRISVLDQKHKKLKIAKGGWTPVEVAITNTGTEDVGKVTVRGKGRALKVRAGTLRSISDGTTHRALVKVKLVGRKKPKKLKLTARAAGGVVAHRTVKVKQVRPPRRAAAGTYRGAKNRIRFQVRKNRITGFRIQTLTRCNGHGNTGNITRDTYAFPTRPIQRNGIVHASAKGKGWTAHLQMRVTGTKVTRAKFRYYGPGGCVAAERFSAKRVGRL